MEPRASFIAELVILAVIVIVLVLRFWVIRHQRRGPEDWFRDAFFATSTFLCMGTTSCLAWYCWKSIEVYQQATLVVDQKIAEAAKNSTIDLTSMTVSQLETLQSQMREERDTNIELMATVMLLDPWYRRFLFFIWGGYFTELWLLKGAFLAFYWRLFSRVQSRFVYLLYGTTVFVIITYIIVLTIHFTWCTPVHRNWTVPLEEFPGTSSINSLTTLTVGSFLNIATDLLILILPLLIVQSFKLRRREMLGLCFIFTVGIMCVTASVVRYVKMYIPYKNPPATMEGVRVAFLWSSLEVMTGFIAFCLPSFRLVLFRAFKRGRDTILHKRRSSAHGLPHVAGYSTGGFSDPKHPSLGSSGTKPKRKNLPRHPNTLLTVDFVTLNTIMSRDEDAGPLDPDSIMYPPHALTREGESVQTRIGVHPAGTYIYPHEPNGIQVTNTISVSTSIAGDSDTPPNHIFPSPSPNSSRTRHPLPSSQRTTPTPTPTPTPTATPRPASLAGISSAAEEEYILMPMQRAYDPSAAHTGSMENLRPTSRNGQYGSAG